MDDIRNIPDAPVVCPNCGERHMEEDRNILTTIDLHEWFSILSATLVLTVLGVRGGGWLLNLVDTPPEAPLGLRIFCWLLVGGLALNLAFWIVSELNREQNRNNGISVWYVRCGQCHRRYRIVRPWASSPPWESTETKSCPPASGMHTDTNTEDIPPA